MWASMIPASCPLHHVGGMCAQVSSDGAKKKLRYPWESGCPYTPSINIGIRHLGESSTKASAAARGESMKLLPRRNEESDEGPAPPAEALFDETAMLGEPSMGDRASPSEGGPLPMITSGDGRLASDLVLAWLGTFGGGGGDPAGVADEPAN